MAKTIAVTGATGVQGGSVARKMLEQGWNVRAITRNVNSDAAKQLSEEGAEVVQASFDDEESLAKAFEGAHAVFGVTNFWEMLFGGKNADESGGIEKSQALALARAAAKSTTLEHYVWSTLPSANKLSNGEYPVPHLDYKAEVDDIMREEMPDLAKKTTFLFIGYYASNLAYFPFCKPIEWPESYGAHVLIQPVRGDIVLPNAGDMVVTPGIWVAAILSRPDKTHGKYAMVAPETISYQGMLAVWSEVTGKRASYVQCTPEEFAKVWGPPGAELAAQMQFHNAVDDWTLGVANNMVSMEELGISAEGIGHRAALKRIKGMGLL